MDNQSIESSEHQYINGAKVRNLPNISDNQKRKNALKALDSCKSPREACEYYFEQIGEYPYVFKFSGQLYKPVFDRNNGRSSKNPIILYTIRILDGYLSPAFALNRNNFDTSTNNLSAYLFVNYMRNGNAVRDLVGFDDREMMSEREFSIALSRATHLTFSGDRADLNFIRLNILQVKEMPRIREMERLGFDESSGAYIFSHLAFTREGEKLLVNEHGYFESINIKPPQQDGAIKEFAAAFNMVEFADLLYRAYGPAGLIVFSYYVATILSPEIFNHREFGGYHPFLSISSLPGTGKTNLLILLNTAITFQERNEGIAAASSNPKGMIRTLAKASCLPIVISENNRGIEADGAKSKIKLDENTYLSLYNRQSPQTRANKSNDLGTNDVPFSAGLIFSQNHENFALRAMKERTISISMEKKEFTNEQKDAYSKLLALAVQTENVIPISGVGVRLFCDRPELVSGMERNLKSVYELLKSRGITDERTCKNYTLILSALHTLQEFYDLALDQVESGAAFLIDLASKRFEECDAESDTATTFFDAFEALKDQEILKKGVDYLESENELEIRLTIVSNTMGLHGYAIGNSSFLRSALRLSSRYIRENQNVRGWIDGRNTKAWRFKRNRSDSIPSA
ncbi:MAG: hypothetical protein NTX25_00305 [Proteobacteria bacterium]|nr:hypothetical protein [Pseudomonadota bacterium]